ncbi:hypothetical protein Tco_0489455 [Tanacetum coccineum]
MLTTRRALGRARYLTLMSSGVAGTFKEEWNVQKLEKTTTTENKQEHEEHLKLILELLIERVSVMLNFPSLAGYYRRFIEGFSKIAKPMTKLTQKKVKFEWGDKQETAFQLLNAEVVYAPILAFLKEANIYRIRAMLFQ